MLNARPQYIRQEAKTIAQVGMTSAAALPMVLCVPARPHAGPSCEQFKMDGAEQP